MAVYEAAAELKEIGAGVALHPNAMKVLRALGVEDSVRRVGGRAQGQVMRNWRTGRVIGRTSRAQQVASFGIPALLRTGPISSACWPPRCRPAWSPWAGGARGSGPTVTSRPRASPTAARSRPTSSSARTESTSPCAPRCSARTRPVHREDLLSQRGPGRRGPRGPARRRGRPVVRPARHDRPVPAARRGADQRRLPLRRRWLPPRVLDHRVQPRGGPGPLRRLVRIPAPPVRRRGHLVQVGAASAGSGTANAFSRNEISV